MNKKLGVLGSAILLASSMANASSDSLSETLGGQLNNTLADYAGAIAGIAVNDEDINASVDIGDVNDIILEAVNIDTEIAVNRISTTVLGAANTGDVSVALEEYDISGSASESSSGALSGDESWSLDQAIGGSLSSDETITFTYDRDESSTEGEQESEYATDYDYFSEIDDDTIGGEVGGEYAASFDGELAGSTYRDDLSGSLAGAESGSAFASGYETDFDEEIDIDDDTEGSQSSSYGTQNDITNATGTLTDTLDTSAFAESQEAYAAGFAGETAASGSIAAAAAGTVMDVAVFNIAYNTGALDASIDIDVDHSFDAQNIDFSTNATGAILTGNTSVGFNPADVVSVGE